MLIFKISLDTNVLIFSIEYPLSNSAIIIEKIIDGGIDVIISEETKLEFINYLKSEYGKDARYHAELFLKNLPNLKIVKKEAIKKHINKFRGKIHDKDLPHLTAAEIERVDCIVSYDRDFKEAKTEIKVLTPREFVEKKLKLLPFDVDY